MISEGSPSIDRGEGGGLIFKHEHSNVVQATSGPSDSADLEPTPSALLR